MKELLRMIKNTGIIASKNSLKALIIWDLIRREKLMERENMSGLMATTLMATGKTD